MVKKAKKKSRLGLLIGAAAVAIVVIAYMATLYPWPSSSDFAGTIGGVNKAKKYRAEQISDNDVVLKD